MSYIVYLRTNKVNGMQYVGQTNNFRKRENYWNEIKSCRYANKYIDGDRKKYGLDAFDVVILDDVETREEAWELEQKYIKELGTKYPNGYNITDGGAGVKGFHRKHTEEENNKVSKTLKEIYKNKKHNMCGKHHSEEQKKKISEGGKGKHTKPIIQYDLNGNFIRKWPSIEEAARTLNISYAMICRCCKGGYFNTIRKKWVNSNKYKGCIWKYADKE